MCFFCVFFSRQFRINSPLWFFQSSQNTISNCLKSKFIVWNHCLKSFTWRSTWLFRFVSAVRESAVSFDGSRRVKNREAENTDELQLLEQSCDFSSWRIYSFISCDLILLSCMDFLKTLAVLFNWSAASSVSEARHIFSLHSVETVWDRQRTRISLITLTKHGITMYTGTLCL